MSLTHPSEVRSLLDRLGIQPNRRLGQNFLIDANILRILLRTADLHPTDVVLEVGPGLGVLTEWLARWARKVVAVEKDRRLAEHLREHLAGVANVEIVEGDIMEQDIEALLAAGVNKVVANLPYAISSRLMFELAESPRRPDQITVTVQKEVAARVVAPPGSKDYGLLSVVLQLDYEPAIVKEISPTCFLPPPEVKSAILNLSCRESPPRIADRGILLTLLKTAFAHRRKQIGVILAKHGPELGAAAEAATVLTLAGLDARARPETIRVNQWITLADAITHAKRS